MESDDFSVVLEGNFQEKPNVGIGGPVSLVEIKKLFKTENLSSIFSKPSLIPDSVFCVRFSVNATDWYKW